MRGCGGFGGLGLDVEATKEQLAMSLGGKLAEA